MWSFQLVCLSWVYFITNTNGLSFPIPQKTNSRFGNLTLNINSGNTLQETQAIQTEGNALCFIAGALPALQLSGWQWDATPKCGNATASASMYAGYGSNGALPVWCTATTTASAFFGVRCNPSFRVISIRVPASTNQLLAIQADVFRNLPYLQNIELVPPSASPTPEPTSVPSFAPSALPSHDPTYTPTTSPTTQQPTVTPTNHPSTLTPTAQPSQQPTQQPTTLNGLYPCSGGRYCPAPAGTYSIALSTPQGCPAGTYAPSGSSTCTPCPVGSYSGPFASHCWDCQAGYYATSGSPCLICPAGTFSERGASACSPCPQGKFSPPGVSACTLCSN